MPNSIEEINAEHNYLTKLPILPLTIQKINIRFNRLTDAIDISFMDHLEYFNCSSNNITHIKSLPPNILYFNVYSSMYQNT